MWVGRAVKARGGLLRGFNSDVVVKRGMVTPLEMKKKEGEELSSADKYMRS